MEARLVRQGFLGDQSDEVLHSARVAIIGLGGGGSHITQQLAHVGVGDFVVIDPDAVDETNLNRLVSATSVDADRRAPKVDVAERVILGLRPEARVTKRQEKWQRCAVLLRDCTVIFGCVDSFAEREQLEIAARRYLVPYIDIGMDVHAVGSEFVISGQVILSMPGERCLRCLGLLTDEILAREAERYGAAGERPQVIWPNGVLASTAVGLFIQLVTPWHAAPLSTGYLEYEGNQHTMTPSNRLAATKNKQCVHHSAIEDVGDPFWKPTVEPAAGAKPSRWRRWFRR